MASHGFPQTVIVPHGKAMGVAWIYMAMPMGFHGTLLQKACHEKYQDGIDGISPRHSHGTARGGAMVLPAWHAVTRDMAMAWSYIAM